MERHIKIYTKTGDDGTTALANGERRSKSDARIIAIGAIDELNASIGVIIAEIQLSTQQAHHDVDTLKTIQQHLFGVGASLALVSGHAPDENDIAWLEEEIDKRDEQLPALTQFILPGGSHTAAELHRSRAICRRSERDLLCLGAQEEVELTVTIYINRLSDLFFMMARDINRQRGVQEEPWKTT